MKRSHWRLLLVDNEPAQISEVVETLQDAGYLCDVALTVHQCKELVTKHRYDAALLDVIMPHEECEMSAAQSRGGTRTGLLLARWIRCNRPHVRLAALSVDRDAGVRAWFNRHGFGLWPKGELRGEALVRRVDAMTGRRSSGLRVFIVHGRNDSAKAELCRYLRAQPEVGELIVLQERPDCGRTILEKFEQWADVDLVFVLLTPDDTGSLGRTRKTKWRARQNVIFELGYFFGRLQRRSGRVVLLYQGALELPTDIAGIGYTKIDEGIDAAGIAIRAAITAARRPVPEGLDADGA